MQTTVSMPQSTRVPAKPATITTTLYDLVAAIHDEVGTDEDVLVTATVLHMLRSGHAKFLNDHESVKMACA